MSTGDVIGGQGEVVRPVLARVMAGIESIASAIVKSARDSRWDALMAVICLVFVYVGTTPLRREEFTYRQLWQARLWLAATALPLVIWGFYVIAPQFELRFFRISSPRGGGPPWRRRLFTAAGAFAGLALLIYLIDPIGVYASGHTKALVPVLFVTDRQPIATATGSVFSGEPSSPETVAYGRAQVPIPWSRQDVDFHTKYLFSWKRESTFIESFPLDRFYAEVAAAARGAKEHDAFVFAHGFHNLFGEGTMKAGKLAYDLKFQGAAILFSWPSGDATSSYDHDHENADWSVKHLRGVLLRLAAIHEIQRLHLIAHSMGSRVLARAVDAAHDAGLGPGAFANIIFAAPDVDEPTFDQCSSALRQEAGRVTIYVSTWDGALLASSGLHKGFRVGLVPAAHDGMDVIDTEGMDTSATNLKHSYLFDSQPVLHDLFLVTENYPPDRRDSVARTNDGCCWKFEHR